LAVRDDQVEPATGPVAVRGIGAIACRVAARAVFAGRAAAWNAVTVVAVVAEEFAFVCSAAIEPRTDAPQFGEPAGPRVPSRNWSVHR